MSDPSIQPYLSVDEVLLLLCKNYKGDFHFENKKWTRGRGGKLYLDDILLRFSSVPSMVCD